MSDCISTGKQHIHDDVCPWCLIAELQAELDDTVTECLAAKSNEDIMRKQLAELEQQCDDSDRELQDALNHLATIKEKARAAVNAPYEDILDMGLAEALRELGELL